MRAYLARKLEEEYHNLSLWYFVFFFYGIIFYFKSTVLALSVKFPREALLLGAVLLAVLVYIILLFRKKEKILVFFTASLIFAFIAGVTIASLRLNGCAAEPISKIDVFDLQSRVAEIKPAKGGAQLILTHITVLGGGKISNRRQKLNKIRINLRGDSFSGLQKGDLISLRAKLFPLGSSLLPDGYDFGLYMYLNSIEATGYPLSRPQIIQTVSAGKFGFYWRKIQNIRNAVYQELIKTLGNDKGNFAAAILIGETKAINPQMAADMRNSGVAHILSVSGLHLSLVAMIFFITARFLLNCSNYLSYKINIKVTAGVISILGSLGYLLLSGANIAATRAFIMTFIVILAVIFERSAYPLRSVMIAGGLILFFLPEYITHPSFQLSFSAVLCLISGYEIYLRNQQWLSRSGGLFGSIKFYIFGNIYSSFLASIVTAPFVIYHFYKFAVYSVPMNLLAVPLMSFFMMPLAIAALVAMPLGLSALPLKLLGFFIGIITDGASYVVSLPGSTINTGYITDMSMLLYTFGFFWICLWQTSQRYFGLLIIFISLILMYLSPKPDLIYDHRLKAVSIKKSDIVNIYSDYKISGFNKEYWLSWYGADKSIFYKTSIADQLFEVSADCDSRVACRPVRVSLNRRSCLAADVQIVTAAELACAGGGLTIPYGEVEAAGVVLVFCPPSGCYVKLGQAPVWKIRSENE